MAKVLVRLADPAEQEEVCAALRLKKFAVSAADPLTAEVSPREAAEAMVEAKVDAVVLDYLQDDAASVKLLQAVTDYSSNPRFVFILPKGVPQSHILMAFNEGAAAVLERPVNTEALANYVERAISGPARFRHEIGRDGARAEEVSEMERDAKAMKMQLAAYRKLVTYLMATPAASQHRNLLVVSDSAYQRDYLKKLFEEYGFHVSLAADPAAGVERTLEERPRIVISDLEMTGMNGVEFCRELKINHKLIPCHFVICTANSEKIESVMAPGNGVDACVLKPSSGSGNMELVASAAMGLLL